jgi:molybdopterin synthase sulfur carrier subunit
MSAETIKVNVLFFGAAAELAGKRNVEMLFPADTKAQSAKGSILAAHPSLNNMYKNSLLFSINREYANGGEVLSDGDELAFFPPVSGG